MLDRVEIAVLRTRQELAGLAPQWSALWRSDPHATPFQSPEWLLPWARQFARRDLCAITIRRGGRLVGLLPLYVYTEPRRHKRQLLLLGAATSDYLGGVFAPACSMESICGAIGVLASERGWDMAYLTQLREGSKLVGALQRTHKAEIASGGSEPCWRMPAVCIGELPGKIRQNARYYRNRAQRSGRLGFRIAETSECLASFDTLCRLHTERWQGSGQRGVLADPRVLAWHREALPLLSHAGMLRLWTLTLDEEPIAALYALADRPGCAERTLYVYLPGFSLRHASLRPGTVLLANVIEQAAKEGIRTIDFLRGEESYKSLWHAHRFPTVGACLRPGRDGAQILQEAA